METGQGRVGRKEKKNGSTADVAVSWAVISRGSYSFPKLPLGLSH